jgi:transposase-like protein
MKKLKCECGSDEFLQEVAYIAIEKVEVNEDNGNFNIISQDMIGVKNNPEHFNHFNCKSCGKKYSLRISDSGIKEFWRVE